MKAHPVELRERGVSFVEKGGKKTEAASYFDVGERTVHCFLKAAREGCLEKEYPLAQGSPPASIHYQYDGIGRITERTNARSTSTSYSHDAAGNLISKAYSDATRGNATESFLWDGLALIHRGGVNYLNEPHPGGGAPIVATASLPSGSRASERIFFNDLLGTTAGTFDADGAFTPSSLTTYGDDTSSSPPSLRAERSNPDHFFTGKPHVAELGHAFLLRNYRSDLGKWHTADPLGYPDGLNNFAYVNGRVTSAVDWLGAVTIEFIDLSTRQFITSANQLKNIEILETGFYSTTKPESVLKLDNDIYICLGVRLSVPPALFFKNEEIDPGALAYYTPHNGGAHSSHGGIFPYEVAYAHEMAHAEAFFNHFPTVFLNLLCYSDLTALSGIQLENEVSRLYSLAMHAYNPVSYAWADDATRGTFMSLGWTFEGLDGSAETWKKPE